MVTQGRLHMYLENSIIEPVGNIIFPSISIMLLYLFYVVAKPKIKSITRSSFSFTKRKTNSQCKFKIQSPSNSSFNTPFWY